MARFYEGTLAMTIVHADRDHVVLDARDIDLVLHALPKAIADTIEITDPPAVREETPIKLCFPVSSLAEVRAKAPALGGGVGPKTREWAARGFRACDGHDPEGNVVQFREAAP